MHLAIVSPYPPNITGIGQYGYHVSRLLALSGVFTRVTVLTGNFQIIQNLYDPTLNLGDLPSPIEIKVAWQPNSPWSGLSLISNIQRIRPDLIWFNLGASAFGRSPLANLSGFLTPLWASRQGFPTVATLHEVVELADLQALRAPGGFLAPLGARLLTRVALQADVICLTIRRYSEWLAEHYNQNRYIHIPIGAYRIPELLPAAVDPPRELLFFSTLAPFKGLEDLLRAYKSLRHIYPDLSLTIAGAEHARFPGYAGHLRQTFGELPGVRWLGQVPESQVRALFERAQIVCIPYTASTGSSSVIFQAALWGRPVIVSDLPEAQAVVNETNMDVVFFDNGSSDSLAQKLRTLLDSTGLQRAQVNKNFAAIQSYRPEDICRGYLGAFNLALETRRSPKRLDIPTQFGLEKA